MYKISVLTGLLAFLSLAFMAASVAHGEEFYKGKTIRLVVGAPPGGGMMPTPG